MLTSRHLKQNKNVLKVQRLKKKFRQKKYLYQAFGQKSHTIYIMESLCVVFLNVYSRDVKKVLRNCKEHNDKYLKFCVST